MSQRKLGSVASSAKPRSGPLASRDAGSAQILPAPPTTDSRAVVAGLLAHGAALAASAGGAVARFTPDEAANALIHNDPFAFLIAVICDQGIISERAWAAPHELRRRLSHLLDPYRLAAEPQAVLAAFTTPPSLHRFVNQVAGWVVNAAGVVAGSYEGDASGIWNDRPSAAKLRRRFDAFPGIGQKKAAMAVEILERDLHVPLSDLTGSDIAYDVYVRPCSFVPAWPSAMTLRRWWRSPERCIQSDQANLTTLRGTSGVAGAILGIPTAPDARW